MEQLFATQPASHVDDLGRIVRHCARHEGDIFSADRATSA
jgi:hypothetical protein